MPVSVLLLSNLNCLKIVSNIFHIFYIQFLFVWIIRFCFQTNFIFILFLIPKFCIYALYKLLIRNWFLHPAKILIDNENWNDAYMAVYDLGKNSCLSVLQKMLNSELIRKNTYRYT